MSRETTPQLAQTERLLYLRTVEAFSEFPARDLAAIAEHTHERLFDAGEVMIRAGKPCQRLFMIIEGTVRLERDGALVGRAGPRAGVAALGVLSQRPASVSAVAEVETLALELEREPLIELLSDNFSMLRTILRMLAQALLVNRRRLGLHAGYDDRPDAGRECPAGELDLVQRLGFLREALPFASEHMAALVDLARHTSEVRLEPGTVVWRQGDPGDWTDVVYCGTVRGEVDGGRQRFYLHDGISVGALDNLAAEARWYTAVAETTVVALRLTADQLLDLFEDRFEIAHAFLKMIAGELVELLERREILGRVGSEPDAFLRTALVPGASAEEPPNA